MTRPHTPPTKGDISSLFSTGTASGPAVTRSNELTEKKREDCRRVVEHTFSLMEGQLHTRDIMTRKVRSGGEGGRKEGCITLTSWPQAFENAITVVYALGGSTNSILHLLALAHE